jgi:hypothetical protein
MRPWGLAGGTDFVAVNDIVRGKLTKALEHTVSSRRATVIQAQGR